MEAILKFNLPEDDSELKMASKAKDAFAALWDFKNEFRSILKYRDPNAEFKTASDGIEHLREKFFEILTDNDIDLDRDYC